LRNKKREAEEQQRLIEQQRREAEEQQRLLEEKLRAAAELEKQQIEAEEWVIEGHPIASSTLHQIFPEVPVSPQTQENQTEEQGLSRNHDVTMEFTSKKNKPEVAKKHSNLPTKNLHPHQTEIHKDHNEEIKTEETADSTLLMHSGLHEDHLVYEETEQSDENTKINSGASNTENSENIERKRFLDQSLMHHLKTEDKAGQAGKKNPSQCKSVPSNQNTENSSKTSKMNTQKEDTPPKKSNETKTNWTTSLAIGAAVVGIVGFLIFRKLKTGK